jgi:hypothetical protein
MPIDFAAIILPFEAPMRLQVKFLGDVIATLGKWLNRRLNYTQELERATRSFPVIDFYDGAVTMSIDESQKRRLPAVDAGQDPGFSGFRRFWEGLLLVPRGIEGELAIPRLLRVIAEALAAITASINRWREPDRSWFDVTIPRRASDLFGQAFVLIDVLAASTEYMRMIVNSAFAAWFMQPSSGNLPETLAGFIQAITAALMLIPLGGQWLFRLIEAAMLGARVLVLRTLRGFESQIYEFREEVIRFFLEQLPATLRTGWYLILAARDILLENLRYYLGLGIEITSQFYEFIQEFAVELTFGLREFWDGLVMDLQNALEGILQVDVLGLITDGWLSLTVQQITDAMTGENPAALRAAVYLLDKADKWYLPDEITERARALREILGQLATTPRELPEDLLPPPFPSFPDPTAHFFGPGASVDMVAETSALFTALTASTTASLDASARAMDGLGDAMAQSAGEMARIGPTAALRRIREVSDQATEDLFGDQRRTLQLQAESNRDALARAFDLAVAGGGFHLVGAAIPLYVEAMSEYWEERITSAVEHPTSPHILARRARLERVRIPAMTVRASGRRLDDDLLGRVATRFRDAIGEAWTGGLRQLEAGA